MRLLLTFVVVLAVCLFPVQAQARSAEAVEVIERLTKAYGGDQLRSLKSVAISSNRRLGWLGQGQTASFVEFGPDRLRKNFDLVDEQGSVERWTLQNGNVYHQRYVVDDRMSQTIDYFTMTSSPSETGGFWQWFSGDFRSSDALMAYRLATSDIAVSHVGVEFYGGQLHDKLTFSIVPDTLEITLFVSQADGLIRRAVMQRDIGEVNFIFGAHRTADGIIYASEIHIYVNEILTEFEWDLAFSPNVDVRGSITVESGLTKPPRSVEQSEMTVDEIGEGVFIVGREDYSLFALDGDSLVAVNAYAGLGERYEALVGYLGRDLPLSAVVITHHHSDHMEAAIEAVALGATLFVTSETEVALKRPGGALALAPMSVLAADDRVGPLAVFVRPTSHATENALVYHPVAKVLFQDDHYHGLVADGPSRIQPTAIEIFYIVSQLEIDVDWIASGHARKTEPWDVFALAVNAAGSRDLCPSGREICRSFLSY